MHKKTKTEQINPRVNLCWAGWWKPGYVEQSRYLYDHELVVFTSGKSQAIVGEQSFSCAKGDMLIIPPGVRHWTRALDERVERYCFHFDWVCELPSVMPPFVYESTGKYKCGRCKTTPKWLEIKMPFYLTGIPLQRLLPLLNPLTECDSSLEGNMKRRGLFLQLLAELFVATKERAETSHGGKSLRLVQALKQRIENDFRHPPSMNSLAREFNVTPVHMARAFRMIVGISPLEYVHRLRLEEAYLLLSDSSMNISEVSESVGFEDANYFSRLFRKKMGMSPSLVRK
ncbi:MAG: helix-turn-helix domain-containing protein [Victivallales bacterium]|jgi:AraC-like DNA-binding protein